MVRQLILFYGVTNSACGKLWIQWEQTSDRESLPRVSIANDRRYENNTNEGTIFHLILATSRPYDETTDRTGRTALTLNMIGIWMDFNTMSHATILGITEIKVIIPDQVYNCSPKLFPQGYSILELMTKRLRILNPFL
ncbi:hypothetical protein EVAR_101533_1 [Eumeta japonica]|uniref:Uncharacterized protein n=1 Tax=Eumeta variegata TaxID=151549 RepID=A0A4C1SGZ4_EUMVA|nr:hypothetical protein EVAR_101533_1 [Eumeta japonica]